MNEEEPKYKEPLNYYRDSAGRIIKVEFIQGGKLIYADEYTYRSPQDKQIDTIFRKYPAGQLISTNEHVYDSQGKKIAQVFKNPEGNITRTLNFEYDPEGNLKREVERVAGQPGYHETLYHPPSGEADIVMKCKEDLEPEELD